MCSSCGMCGMLARACGCVSIVGRVLVRAGVCLLWACRVFGSCLIGHVSRRRASVCLLMRRPSRVYIVFASFFVFFLLGVAFVW